MPAKRRATEIGALVKQLREEAGYRTQQELADALRRESDQASYSRSSVAAVESGGTPSSDFIQAFIKAVPGAADRLDQALQSQQARRVEATSSSPIVRALLEELENLQQERDDPKILRYQTTFSRFLFLEGEMEARVRLGQFAEESAARLDDRRHQAAALIDDLGWSLYVLRSTTEAENHIRHGLDVAEANSLPYWQSKAYRHLSGIALERDDVDGAEDLVRKARQSAEAIVGDTEKSEMVAGIEYGAALVAFARGQFETAKESLALSENMRRLAGDHSRTVKTRAMFGKIFERLGKHYLAHDSFRAGLEESRSVGRKDEQIRNLSGLSRTYRAMGREADADAAEREAQELSRTLHVPYEELSTPEL